MPTKNPRVNIVVEPPLFALRICLLSIEEQKTESVRLSKNDCRPHLMTMGNLYERH